MVLPEILSFFDNSAPDCLILVHPDIQQLEKVKEWILSNFQVGCIAIGRDMSAALLNTSPAHRSRTARSWLETALRDKSPGPILCSDIDLLFQPSFDLDPLRLFRQISRFTRILALWPGTYQDDVLAYAVPEHQHYRTWRGPQVDILGVPNALS